MKWFAKAGGFVRFAGGLLVLVSGFLGATETPKAIVITNGEWPPYQSQHLPHEGFVSLLVKESFAAMGVTVQYRFRPWKRAYEEAKSGLAQATMVWSRTQEREADFWFSAPIITSEAVLFHHKSLKLDWHQFRDLEPYRIGGTLGYQYKIEEWKPLVIHRTVTDEQNLRMLSLKRIDLFPCDLQACLHLLRTRIEPEVADQITYHPRPYDQTDYFVLFSRKRAENPALIEAFNKGLAILKQSGRYAQIVSAQKSGTLDQLDEMGVLHPAL